MFCIFYHDNNVVTSGPVPRHTLNGCSGSPTRCPPSELPPRQGAWRPEGGGGVGAGELLPLRPAPQSASLPHLVCWPHPSCQLQGSMVVQGYGHGGESKCKDSLEKFPQRRGASVETESPLKLGAKSWSLSQSDNMLLYHLASTLLSRKGFIRDDALKS